MGIPYDGNPLGISEARFPANGLVLYMPMTSMSEVYSSDGKASASDYSSSYPVEFTEHAGIACAYCYDTSFWTADRTIRISNVLGSLPFGSAPRTFSFWCMRSNMPAWDGTALWYGSASGDGRCICVKFNSSNAVIADFYNGGTDTNVTYGNVQSTADVMNDRKWHHIAVSLWNNESNRAAGAVWIDGTKKYEGYANAALDTGTAYSYAFIGGRSPQSAWNRPLNGLIAGFRAYDRVLSGSEISQLAKEFNPTT